MRYNYQGGLFLRAAAKMATAVDKPPWSLARHEVPPSSPARHPMTEEEAAKDIRRIRENKEVERSTVNTSDLEAALVL